MCVKFIAAVVLAGVVLLASACERGGDIHDDRLSLLGTFARVSIASMTQESAATAARTAEQRLKSLDAIGYNFETDSELHRLNEAIAHGRVIDVSDTMLDLLRYAHSYYIASKGLLNPAVGKLTELWEYHCDDAECSEPGHPDKVRRLIKEQQSMVLARRPEITDLIIHGNRVGSTNHAVQLEFGGLIRGYALDKGIKRLQQAGASNAMIDIDGNVHTIGSRGDQAWWISIPDASGKHYLGSIDTNEDESVFTVRASERSPGKQDLEYRPVVDPRNGEPVENIKSVTVVHRSAMTANVAATALMIAGIENWKVIADSMDAHQILLITADGTIYTSPAIDHRIHWKQGVSHKHLVTSRAQDIEH